MADTPPDSSASRFRIRREPGGFPGRAFGEVFGRARGLVARMLAPAWAAVNRSELGSWAQVMWRRHRLFRLAGSALGVLLAVYAVFWVAVIRNLPSADTLLTYQPPLPTMVRGADGGIIYSYARERRVQLRYVDFPPQLIHAFLSAEDKNFFSHGGVDLVGLGEAVVEYTAHFGSGQRTPGHSTITQQVAKNILVGNEHSVTRKLKEMLVARRIEAVLSKQQILEIYFNEIALGRQSFGVQAAARAYFGKDVGDLDLAQSAFLAILPKEPEILSRAANAGKAIGRRNWVLDQMVKNGWVTPAAAAAAKAQPLGLIARRPESWDPSVNYFVEEVRRTLLDQYGESADDGPNSVYAGGLWVRTSLDLPMQKATQDALATGLITYNGPVWHGPVAHIDFAVSADGKPQPPADWPGQIARLGKSLSYKDWRVGLVLHHSGSSGTIGFADGTTGGLFGIPAPARDGDVVAASPTGTNLWAMHIVPAVSGGMMVEAPYSGRVLALAGGFDMGLDSFNRATQAERQPGSAIKPFVYATALDNGMTPATMVPDQSLCVYQGAQLGQKCFKNFGNEGGGGTHTMRWGLEQSRNLMTVHIANDTGMAKVVKTLKEVGIGSYQPYLSYSLGAGETTVARILNAYAALAANGLQPAQTLIDTIQDRGGKVIWRADQRNCTGCNMAEWDGRPMPRFAPRGVQVLDPRTAFQVEHMLEGVVTRGTAASLGSLGLPLFGKTGTTSGPTNVWFVGGSPNIIAATYIGYDQPRSLGSYAQGATYAVPIFRQMVEKTRERWDHTPFLAPPGVNLVRIARASGQRVFAGDASDDAHAEVIWEAFKPETEPETHTRQEQVIGKRQQLLDAIARGFAALGGHVAQRRPAAPDSPGAPLVPGPAPSPTVVPAEVR